MKANSSPLFVYINPNENMYTCYSEVAGPEVSDLDLEYFSCFLGFVCSRALIFRGAHHRIKVTSMHVSIITQMHSMVQISC